MTKTDYRIPRPTYRRPDDVPVSLRALQRRLARDGFARTFELGALAMLNMVNTAELGDGAVTLAKIAGVSSQSILGRATAGTGAPEELTLAQVAAMLGLSNAVLGSDHSIASTTATEVAGLTLPLTAGTYNFRYTLFCQTTNTNVGLALGVNYTGTATRFLATRWYPAISLTDPSGFMVSQASTPTGRLLEQSVARTLSTTTPNLGPNEGAGGPNVDCLNVVEGVIEVSDSGDLQLWHSSQSATATSVESGSMVVVTKAA